MPSSSALQLTFFDPLCPRVMISFSNPSFSSYPVSVCLPSFFLSICLASLFSDPASSRWPSFFLACDISLVQFRLAALLSCRNANLFFLILHLPNILCLFLGLGALTGSTPWKSHPFPLAGAFCGGRSCGHPGDYFANCITSMHVSVCVGAHNQPLHRNVSLVRLPALQHWPLSIPHRHLLGFSDLHLALALASGWISLWKIPRLPSGVRVPMQRESHECTNRRSRAVSCRTAKNYSSHSALQHGSARLALFFRASAAAFESEFFGFGLHSKDASLKQRKRLWPDVKTIQVAAVQVLKTKLGSAPTPSLASCSQDY